MHNSDKAGRPNRRQRGYDEEWERLRAIHLRYNPICAVRGCGKRGRHVDHIENVRETPSKRLQPGNLQTLCQRHHNQLTWAYDRGSIRGACDVEGMPRDPQHPWAQPDNQAALATVLVKPSVPASVAMRLKLAAVRGDGRTH